MSLHGPAVTTSDIFYTPAHASNSLLAYADDVGLFPKSGKIWECAAGQGHVARVLASRGHQVLATDIVRPSTSVYPVGQKDFLSGDAPSGKTLSIVTNPPYGQSSKLIIAFLQRAFELMCTKNGAIAMLVPFEFDAAWTRADLVGDHPWFVGKVTCKRRIRWLNIPQVENGPMGCHSWLCYSNELAVIRRARALPSMVVR